MSSFYDDASLVVIPSGYKTSKVYAEKPTDGSGDLAFTRTGDTATRVNSAGLIEKVRTNLTLFSEQMNNAAWTAVSCTVSANVATSPDGSTNADSISTTAANSFFGAAAAVTIAANTSTYTQSIFVKWVSGSEVIKLRAALTGGTSLAKESSINIRTGVVVSTDTTAQVVSYGNGWYRISHQATNNSTNTNFVYQFYPTNDGTNTNVIYLWGSQLETGDIATDYIPTTTAAVSVGPVANVPRLDYLGSTCPRLLLEPQRTNLGLWSEQFNNAGWTNAATTITANYGVSPDGYTNADRFQQTAIGALQQTISVTASTAYTVSFYCKLLGGTSASLGVYNFSASNFIFQDNLFSSLVLNQWVRITRTFTTPVGCTSITGELWRDSTIDCLVYGFQMEAGAYATSYIPTLAAAATRGADACSKTGISSLIGQTEGVMFIDFVWNGLTGVGSYPRIIELGTDSNNYIQLFSIAGTTSFMWDVLNGGVVQFTGSSTMALGRNKIAIGYKLNDMVVYRNGTLLASDTSCTVPATSALGVTGTFDGSAGAQLAASVNQTLLFKTRLTNAELATLTTL